MHAKIGLTEPDKALCTIEITMPLGDWKEIRQQLSHAYPSWKLGNVISDLIDKAQTQFIKDSFPNPSHAGETT